MTEALTYFLDDTKMCHALDEPDEGIDYIFMLEASEWKVLESEWRNRDENWKETMIYFSGFVNTDINKELLIKAITDKNIDVIVQGILSIHQSITENEGQCSFTSDQVKIIREITSQQAGFDTTVEYKELLSLL